MLVTVGPWPVCPDATKDHTLVRKAAIQRGETDWALSAGVQMRLIPNGLFSTKMSGLTSAHTLIRTSDSLVTISKSFFFSVTCLVLTS